MIGGVLAGLQAALRRVATLVARGVAPTALFDAVAEEVHRLLQADITLLLRYESDGTATAVGGHDESGVESRLGETVGLEGDTVIAHVARTGPGCSASRIVSRP